MQFHVYLTDIATAVRAQNGEKLGSLLSLDDAHIPKLLMAMHDSSRMALARYVPSIVAPWGEIAIAHVQVIVTADDAPEEAFKEQDALVNQHFLGRFFKDATSWALPVVYILLRDLRKLAEKADIAALRSGPQSAMEAAARTCNKAFSLCISDRNPAAESRRWGSYYLAGLVMKCYFKINTISLSRNIMRALKANPEIPPLETFPKLHQLTYRYYVGLLSFLNEEYQQAEEELSIAFNICHYRDTRNQERILAYLVPLRILRGQVPCSNVLAPVPLYGSFISLLRAGHLGAYDKLIGEQEARLVRLGVWYIWEKIRDICLQRLFRRVWLITSQSTRIPIADFHAAVQLSVSGANSSRDSGDTTGDEEETECLVANMIYKGYMKGYLSHEKQMVVLSAKSAFPPLSERPNPFL